MRKTTFIHSQIKIFYKLCVIYRKIERVKNIFGEDCAWERGVSEFPFRLDINGRRRMRWMDYSNSGISLLGAETR